MVRLRQEIKEQCCGCGRISIPLWCDCDSQTVTLFVCSCINFNPTMVRLRRCRPSSLCSDPYDFNPTMVRLRLELTLAPIASILTISIPLWCDCDLKLKDDTQVYLQISIPLWCDCDKHAPALRVGACAISIPLWCDCDSPSPQCAIALLPYFNPTMVRLRRILRNVFFVLCALFQSHYGAIATFLPLFDHGFEK